MAKKMRRGQKQCPKCRAWVKGARAKTSPQCDYQFNGKQEAAPALEPAAAEKKAGDTVTFDQVRAVTQTVRGQAQFDDAGFGPLLTKQASKDSSERLVRLDPPHFEGAVLTDCFPFTYRRFGQVKILPYKSLAISTLTTGHRQAWSRCW